MLAAYDTAKNPHIAARVGSHLRADHANGADPFSGRQMIYRPQGTNWLLYSVGEDGVDHGGKRVGSAVSGTATMCDLFYDSPY
jgi:hypothetical protein